MYQGIRLVSVFILAVDLLVGTTWGGFVISKIADTNSPSVYANRFSTVGVDNGLVIFHAYAPGPWQSIYLHQNGVITRIVDSNTVVPSVGGTFARFSACVIGEEVVGFQGWTANDFHGVYTYENGTVSLVADQNTIAPTATKFTFLDSPDVSNGAVVFFATTDPAYHDIGVYLANGSTITTLVDTNTAIPGGIGTFSFVGVKPNSYEDGDFVFRGAGTDQNGIYTLFDGLLDVVTDLNRNAPGTSSPFVDIDQPTQSKRNIVFRAISEIGPGIFAELGSGVDSIVDTLTVIPDGTGNFLNFGKPSIYGTSIAFEGIGYEQDGVYTTLGGSLVKVIDLGDELDGKTPTRFQLYRQAIDHNTIAFRAEFTDGSQGVFVATQEVPEPSTIAIWSLMGFVGVCFGWYRRRAG